MNELRFKDATGRDFPEWEVVELEKIALKINKKNKDLSLNIVLTNSATQGIVSQSDYFERDIANQNNLGGYYVVQTDDFVYNPRISANALVGPIKRNNLHVGVMSPLYTVFRFNEGDLDFFEQYFQTNHWHDYMKSVSNSGARHDRMNITNESFFGLPLPYPSKPEQTKIANFLTAVDEKITQLTQKCDLLAQYKKGVMQQIFSQELRFKDDDGQDYPEWEETTLGEISVKKSSNIAANKIEENEGDYKIYGAAGVLKKVDFFTQNDAYISIVKDGAGVGRVFLCEPKTSVLGTMDIIQPKENVDISFLYAVLEQIDFVIYVTGSTIPHIYYKDYSKEEISVPSLKEQTKIANFLTALDDKITATKTQLQAVKQYKQGLLQQMFV